jgi:hypothetical protein
MFFLVGLGCFSVFLLAFLCSNIGKFSRYSSFLFMLSDYRKFVSEFVSLHHSCNVADIKKKTFDLSTVTAECKVKCTHGIYAI